MFEAHYQPDPRLPGWVSGSSAPRPTAIGSSATTGSCRASTRQFLVAPDDGIGVIGFTNGSNGAFAWLAVELRRLLRGALGLSADDSRLDAPHHPEVWAELCGRYVLPPRIADLRERLLLGGGADVFVRGGRLMLRLLTPVPALLGGLLLQPDDPADPHVFRLDLSPFGMPPVRVVFAQVINGRATAIHTDFGGQPWSLIRVPDARTRNLWVRPVVAGITAAAAITAVRRHRAATSKEAPP